MNDDTQTMTRKPPLWLKREPMTRAAVLEQLDRWAAGNVKLASASRDPDIAAGLRAQAMTQAQIAEAIRRGALPSAAAGAHLEQLRDARLGMARATTEPQARSTYVDAWHAYAEAVRYLKGG